MEETVHRRRLAGAPISWGVCEAPGWGRQLAPDRVLAEMTSLGLRATELGPVGYLPLGHQALRGCLGAHGLRLVGGFVPLVLHERDAGAARVRAKQMSELFAAAGAEVFVAAIVADDEWSVPPSEPLSDDAWERLVAHLEEVDALVGSYGLRLVVHSHWGTLIERDATVQRLLADSHVAWCVDTGHLLIGGTDPAGFVRRHGARILHVHLKDVDSGLAARVRDGELSLVDATRAGLFRPLGQGDAGIDEVLRALADVGYEGWLVLEQDAALAAEPPAGGGPVHDVARSVAYLTAIGER